MSNNTPAIKEDRILIDYGSQYSQLIARRVREAGVFCEMYPTTSIPVIEEFGAKGLFYRWP